jgi:predicted neutral ceramidase superfamily lipid hydrolase
MAVTILSSPFVMDLLLPFVLVFAIVFAVLQKAKIFGEGKRQSDAIVALAVALITVAVGTATNIITNLIPILAVGLVAVLAFMLLYGFVFKEGGFEVPKGVQITVGILAAILIAGALAYFTGAWAYLRDIVGGGSSTLITNTFFILVVIGAVIAVIFGGKGGEAGK